MADIELPQLGESVTEGTIDKITSNNKIGIATIIPYRSSHNYFAISLNGN